MVTDAEIKRNNFCYTCGSDLGVDTSCSVCREREWQRELREQERRKAAEQERTSRTQKYGSSSSAGGGILAIPGAIFLLIAKWDLVLTVWLGIGSFMAPLLPFGLSYVAATAIVGIALLVCGYILIALVLFGGCLAVIGAIVIPVFYLLVFRELPPGLNFSSRDAIHQQRQKASPVQK
jgi:hypothetical protein